MKTCKKEGCIRPVFSHLYCTNHQYLRPDKPKKPLFKHKEIKPTHTLDFGFDSQIDLFNWLWEDSKNEKGEVFCKFTGEKLNKFYNTEIWFSCFAHILPKGKYTYFKLNPKNVKVVSPFFHKIIDQGTSLDRTNHPGWKFGEWDNEVERMKIQYVEFKKQNLLA
jgi:hypothetical protein